MTTDLDHLERLRAEATEGNWGGDDYAIKALNFPPDDDQALRWLGVSSGSSYDEITRAIGDAQAREGQIQQDRWEPRANKAEAEVRELRSALAESERHNLTHLQMYGDSQAEVQELRATVQRVEKLTDNSEYGETYRALEDIRAALNGDDHD